MTKYKRTLLFGYERNVRYLSNIILLCQNKIMTFELMKQEPNFINNRSTCSCATYMCSQLRVPYAFNLRVLLARATYAC